MAFNFNNNLSPQPSGASPTDNREAPPQGPSLTGPSATSPVPNPPVTSDVPLSAAVVRFRSCRWQQPIEDGGPEFCTHREVKPLAGTIAFDAQAWCPDCQYYKLRRTPKKRNYNEDYSY